MRQALDLAMIGTTRSPRPPVKPLLVLPTLNEVASIERVIDASLEAVERLSILVVDDGSSDGTIEALHQKVSDYPARLHLMLRADAVGLGRAYRDGFRWGLAGGYDALVEMDADLQHDPADLEQIVGGLSKADVVIGSRYVDGGAIPEGWHWARKVLSRFGNLAADKTLGLSVSDSTSGYRAYSADLLRRIDFGATSSAGYAFQVEMTHLASQASARILEVPIRFGERTGGESKMTASIALEAALLLGRLRLRNSLKSLRPRTFEDRSRSNVKGPWYSSSGEEKPTDL